MYNIIGDVAGRYKELMLLIEKMPKDSEIILLGDLNDRGPDSDKVIKWCLDNHIRSVHSNHGKMLIDYYNTQANPMHDGNDMFLINGGYQTMLSYGDITKIPPLHIHYLETRPHYIMENGLFLSHAPWHPDLNIDEACNHETNCLLWNRTRPVRRNKIFQIHGHNTYHEVYEDEQGKYGMCIDNSGFKELMGIHWPSMKIYSQAYLE